MYEHVPPLQLPFEYTRRAPATQLGAGGVVHMTPAHGSALQTPPVQPKVQAVSLYVVYAQLPPLQVPFVYTRRFEPEHTGAGGVVQVTPVHGSP